IGASATDRLVVPRGAQSPDAPRTIPVNNPELCATLPAERVDAEVGHVPVEPARAVSECTNALASDLNVAAHRLPQDQRHGPSVVTDVHPRGDDLAAEQQLA